MRRPNLRRLHLQTWVVEWGDAFFSGRGYELKWEVSALKMMACCPAMSQ